MTRALRLSSAKPSVEARARHGKGQLRDRMKLVGFLFSKKQGCAGLEVKHPTVKKAFLENWSIGKMLKQLALKNVKKPSDVQKIPSGTLPTKTESVTKFLDFPTKSFVFSLRYNLHASCNLPGISCLESARQGRLHSEISYHDGTNCLRGVLQRLSQ